MKKSFIGITVLAIVTLACSTLMPAANNAEPTVAEPGVGATNAPTQDTASRLEGLGSYPCPDSDFICVKLPVPLNHFDPSDSRMIDVVFGVLPATGERKGMFVTATGGPGSAGLASADSYTATMDPAIPEQYDIVFFDQRGVGQSGNLQCVNATAKYYLSDFDTSTPEKEAALLETARTFASECVAEMGNPDILPYLGTAQAVEDLEIFRQVIGDEKFWLYGESYGTQYAQTYAAAHPDHLAGMILDGTVDLTLSGVEYYVQQTAAFNNALQLTLEACNADDICAETMGGGDAIAAYNKLSQRLKQEPIEFDFPLPSGGVAKRTFTFSDLETSATGYMYSETLRMMFLRALAAYSRNEDIVPMARILYNSLAIDPETLEAMIDPSYSDAIYYGVECQDYSYFSGTPEERGAALMQAGNEVEQTVPNFSSLFYGDIPCLFWPNAVENAARPAPLTADGIPTLVLGAIADPATPVSNGINVFRRLDDGYLVTQEGGPHVTYGVGSACVDAIVTEFMVNGQPPSERESTCEGVVADEFVPLLPLDAKDFSDPLEALSMIDDEIYYLPEYYYWDYFTPTSIGCPFGGVMSFEATDTSDSFSLEACSFTSGFSLTGSGLNNYDDGTFTLEVTVSGLKEGTLTYIRDAEGTRSVSGEYGGEAVELSR
ncbi:alpha/beta hydrolase [Candidatus Villigracilis affinis]|uniref:alpha/beta hydrolase n=1 Tax=Candidatus Villigracilis affinis TaxID=3140682 RepID=UPI002A1C0102|nr:alpha/beta fold hydrolase [Anaerolineales bacterium]